MGRRGKYTPIVEIRFEPRFWPENLEDILDVGPRFLTMTPPFDEELLYYIYIDLVQNWPKARMFTHLGRSWGYLYQVGPADFVDHERCSLGYLEKIHQEALALPIHLCGEKP